MSTKFDNLWILMSKYTFQIDSDTIYEDLTCMICKKIMIDSCQSECGCQYCYKCIREYLISDNQYCPGIKDECKEECLSLNGNVLRNAMLNKKVSKLKVRCPNESCELKVELIKMEGHLLLCMKDEIKSPYAALGCDNKNENKYEIMSHLNEDIFKNNHLIIKYIQNMKNELTCLKNSSHDIDNMKMEIISLKNKLEVTKLEMKSLKEKSIIKENIIKDYFEKTNLEMAYLKEESIEKEIERKALKKEVLDLSDAYKSLKEESIVKETQNIVESDKMRIHITASGDEENDRIKKLFLREMYDFVWTIKDFSKKAELKHRYYFSDPFYTNYYKFCLSIIVKNTHVPSNIERMELYVYILKGENDDIVQWPMQNPRKVNIVNPLNLETWEFKYNTYTSIDKSAFNKPDKWDEKNFIDFGFIERHTMEKSTGLINEDSVIIGFSLLLE